MKKILLLTALLGIMFGASAQNTDYAVLTIVLHPVQSIEVEQRNVNIYYNNKTDYTDGVSVEKENHLKVFSTGSFVVRVSKDKIATNGGAINDGAVTITPNSNSNNPLYGTTMNTVSLTTDPQELISSGSSAYNHTYNITYKGVGNGSFLDFVGGKAPNRLTTTVTYTINPN